MIDKLLNFTTCSQNEKSAILEERYNLTSLNSSLRPLHGLLLTAPVCLTQYTSFHTLERWGKNKIRMFSFFSIKSDEIKIALGMLCELPRISFERQI